MLVQASAESLPADTTQDFRKGGRGLGFSVYGALFGHMEPQGHQKGAIREPRGDGRGSRRAVDSFAASEFRVEGSRGFGVSGFRGLGVWGLGFRV